MRGVLAVFLLLSVGCGASRGDVPAPSPQSSTTDKPCLNTDLVANLMDEVLFELRIATKRVDQKNVVGAILALRGAGEQLERVASVSNDYPDLETEIKEAASDLRYAASSMELHRVKTAVQSLKSSQEHMSQAAFLINFAAPC